jgi:hypothetical protein
VSPSVVNVHRHECEQSWRVPVLFSLACDLYCHGVGIVCEINAPLSPCSDRPQMQTLLSLVKHWALQTCDSQP